MTTTMYRISRHRNEIEAFEVVQVKKHVIYMDAPIFGEEKIAKRERNLGQWLPTRREAAARLIGWIEEDRDQKKLEYDESQDRLDHVKILYAADIS